VKLDLELILCVEEGMKVFRCGLIRNHEIDMEISFFSSHVLIKVKHDG
jgi:hypothetical protein